MEIDVRKISLRNMEPEGAIIKLIKYANRPLFPFALAEGLLLYGFRCESVNFKGYVGNYIRSLVAKGLLEQAPSGTPSWEYPQGLRLTKKGKKVAELV